MTQAGWFVRVDAKPGRAAELEDRIRSTLPAIEAETGTTAWLAVRLGPTSYAVLDVFPGELDRQAHLEAGRLRLAAHADLLAEPPSIVPTEVIAAKLPGSAKLEANKQTVLAFYRAFLRKDFEAASELMGDRYVQHNPLVADGREGFKAFLDYMRQAFPRLRAEIKRVFADGDFVIAHLHGIRDPQQRGSAIIDIFRLEEGKIVEHWDVNQPIPEQLANPNGMF